MKSKKKRTSKSKRKEIRNQCQHIILAALWQTGVAQLPHTNQDN